MIAYRESDIHFSWSHGEGQGGTDTWPHICGYVKEGEDEGEVSFSVKQEMHLLNNAVCSSEQIVPADEN
jgi:hypothetical protein